MDMIVIDELPFSFVEKKGFNRVMSLACPRFQMPSRHTVTRDLDKLYEDEKVKLRKLLASSSSRVCLTTDTWSSVQKNSYMCVTAHFVDDGWVLRKKVIHFHPITSHAVDVFGKDLEKVLRDWGLDRLLTISVDNATNNDVAISYLKKRQEQSRTSMLGGKYLHVRCVAHIINLIMHDGLKDM